MQPHIHSSSPVQRAERVRRRTTQRFVTALVAGAAVLASATAVQASPWNPETAGAVWQAAQRTPAVARASESMVMPFRGSGTWADVYDWSKAYGGAAFNLSSVDKVAAAGYQTLYIQTAKAKDSAAVLEPARLKALINRAHKRGMKVVGWYLPTHTDEDRDYRKTIAMLRLGVDGIGLDLESTALKNVPKRSAAAVRLMERVSRKITQSGQSLGLAAITYTPYTLESSKRLWPNFPWDALAPFTHVWMPMSYWSQQLHRNNGYGNATTFSTATIKRLRELLGINARIHLIGGSGQDATQAERMVAVVKASDSNVIGASLYDWRTTRPSTNPKMSPLRTLRNISRPASSEVVAAGDLVAYQTSAATVQLARLRTDGTWADQHIITGAEGGVPSIAIDNRSSTENWFVVARTATGIGYATGNNRGGSPKLLEIRQAPDGCLPSASRWSRAGFVVLCTNASGASFSLLDSTTKRWTPWVGIPLPDASAATSLVATPLGSQLVLAWLDASDHVMTALWDAAVPSSLTTVPVRVAGGFPLIPSSALRLNGLVRSGSDTTTEVLLSVRTSSGAVRISLTREVMSGASVTAPIAELGDATSNPVTDVFMDVGASREVHSYQGALVVSALRN